MNRMIAQHDRTDRLARGPPEQRASMVACILVIGALSLLLWAAVVGVIVAPFLFH